MPPGQQLDHLPDLDDLLGGAAEKAEQRLAQRLSQQAQAAKRLAAARQVRIAPPGQGVGQLGEADRRREILRQLVRDRVGKGLRRGPQ
jgi:hypothetical protein